MGTVITFLIGLFTGGAFGAFIVALLAVNDNGDDER